jgi:hypothetical protein
MNKLPRVPIASVGVGVALLGLALLGLAQSQAAIAGPQTPQTVAMVEGQGDDPAPDFYCIACHTTGPILQELAVEEEEAEELSQGPG